MRQTVLMCALFNIVCLVTCANAEKLQNAKSPTAITFYDWYDVWAGNAGYEQGKQFTPNVPCGVRLVIQPAERSRVFFRRKMRWEQGRLSHMFILYENGRYRMWYGASPVLTGYEDYICYAESKDGFEWERPSLNLVEFRGQKENNIICKADWFGMHSVFIDPTAPAQQRYKAISPELELFRKGKQIAYSMEAKWDIRRLRAKMHKEGFKPEDIDKEARIGRMTLRGAVSKDGINWRILAEPLKILSSTADTQNIAAYDPQSRQYVAYLRGHLGRRRIVARTGGEQFGNWPKRVPVLFTDPLDPPDDDIYTTSYCREPLGIGVGRHLMFPAIYHRANDTIDVELATSRDGVQWSRPEHKPIIGRQTEDPNHSYGCIYASPNLVPLGSNQWAIAYSGYFRRHNEFDHKAHGSLEPEGEYRWAMWKRQQLVALEAKQDGSFALVAKPCSLGEVLVNFQTAADGWIKIALIESPSRLGAPFTELEGFEMDASDPLVGDHLAARATWKGNGDTSSLKGKNVGLYVRLYKAKLFSIKM